eukprot:Pgem_evm1s19859
MIEIFDSKTNKVIYHENSTAFTRRVGFKNLYPVVQPVPPPTDDHDNIYTVMFSCNQADLVQISKNNTITTIAMLPDLDKTICTAFSATGTAKLLALSYENDYEAEMISFGGTRISEQLEDKCYCDVPALSTSFRINVNPENIIANKSKWEIEVMPFPRVGGTAVLLPNGQFVLLNGGLRGTGNDYIGEAIRTAVLYDPYAKAGERYSNLATSEIGRYYHSNAVLLPDGNILVAGQDQGSCFGNANGGPLCGTNYEVEFRAEKFYPPYYYVENRVGIIGVDNYKSKGKGFQSKQEQVRFSNNTHSEVKFGEWVTIYYDADVAVDEKITGASLVSPSAVTHSTDMSGKVVFLRIRNINKHTQTVQIQIPKFSRHVVNSGYHMIFLLTENNKVPSKNSVWIHLTK